MPKWQVVFLVMLGLLNNPVGRTQSPRPVDERGDASAAQFVISGGYILVPDGQFLLVRKGRQIGAIRFAKVERDAQGHRKATYQSYFQGDGSGSLLAANVVRRSGEIDIKPMKGVHPFAWQPGHNKVWLGKWWFGCMGPSLINMSSQFAEKDNGFEFAPTSAREISQVDASDKRLHWFRYDPNARISLPVSELPK